MWFLLISDLLCPPPPDSIPSLSYLHSFFYIAGISTDLHGNSAIGLPRAVKLNLLELGAHLYALQ